MKKQIEPDISAEIKLYPTAKGGLENSVFLPKVGCILTYKDENFSCFLLLPKDSQVFPGDRTTLPIKFLYPDLIKPNLKIGDAFTLRDYRVIADGTVVEIFPDIT